MFALSRGRGFRVRGSATDVSTWRKKEDVISSGARNLTESMEPEFGGGEISPCGRNDGPY